MKISSVFLFTFALAFSTSVRAQVSTGAGGEGVTVGNSDLIGTVQESDTYTIGSDASTGTRNGASYSVGGFPLTTQEAILESAYNHSQNSPSWETGAFSINNDANYVDAVRNGAPFFQTYPGSSGAGSSNGFTQTGLGSMTTDGPVNYTETHSIAYGLGTNFVVQSDAVQTNDWIDIEIGSTRDSIFSSDGLTVFFRPSADGATSLGLFNAALGEVDFSFQSSNVTVNQWNNYAVGFDLATNTLSLYTNEVLDGTVNLATFDGGAYAGVLDSSSNAFVGVGGHESPPTSDDVGLLWTDNFEVGTAAPEPTTWAMLIAGLGLLAGIGRLRRLNG